MEESWRLLEPARREEARRYPEACISARNAEYKAEITPGSDFGVVAIGRDFRRKLRSCRRSLSFTCHVGIFTSASSRRQSSSLLLSKTENARLGRALCHRHLRWISAQIRNAEEKGQEREREREGEG